MRQKLYKMLAAGGDPDRTPSYADVADSQTDLHGLRKRRGTRRSPTALTVESDDPQVTRQHLTSHPVCLVNHHQLAGVSPGSIITSESSSELPVLRVIGCAEAEYASVKEVQTHSPYHKGNPAASIS